MLNEPQGQDGDSPSQDAPPSEPTAAPSAEPTTPDDPLPLSF